MDKELMEKALIQLTKCRDYLRDDGFANHVVEPVEKVIKELRTAMNVSMVCHNANPPYVKYNPSCFSQRKGKDDMKKSIWVVCDAKTGKPVDCGTERLWAFRKRCQAGYYFNCDEEAIEYVPVEKGKKK